MNRETEMKLKPCPFCRKVPTLQTADDGTAARVFCQNIFCIMLTVMTPICAHADEAIDIWDTRAASDLLGACLEALQIYVDRVERGELEHRYPYSKYKAILAKIKGEGK